MKDYNFFFHKGTIYFHACTYLGQASRLLQVPVSSQEWEGKEKAVSTPPDNAKRNFSVLNFERQVGVDSGLWGTVNREIGRAHV